MQNSTLKHGLRKNLPVGTMYNSQAAAIAFSVGIAFKLSSAPGIISTYYGSSTLWVFVTFTVVEALSAILIFSFVRMRGDSLLRATNNKLYRLTCLVCSIWLTMKCIFYFCYSVSYLTHELFTGTQPYLIYVLFLLPVVYLGIKGTRTIARTCELFSLAFFAIILLNLVFLDGNVDVGRNLPVFAVEPKDFFLHMPSYGMWLGDLFPFVFTRIRNKRFPYLTCGLTATWTLANVIVMLGVAMYGNALKIVSDLLIHIASFNQLSLEIGRMEWTNLFTILMMSLFSVSFLFDGANNACERALGSGIPSKLLCPLAILLVSIFVPSAQTVTNFAMNYLGYIFTTVALLLPILLCLVALAEKKKSPKLYASLDCEYVCAHEKVSQPDSANDGVALAFETDGTKGEAI